MVNAGGALRGPDNRTFPDIGVIQITYGGDDAEDRLNAELRTWNSEREL